MKKDVPEGEWKQIRGEAQSRRGRLTDDDLDRAAGRLDILSGLLQEKSGYTRQHAADEINGRVAEFEARLTGTNAGTPARK